MIFHAIEVKSSFCTCLTKGVFHRVLFFTEDQLTTSLDQVENNASFLEVLHVVFTSALIESQSVLDEVVYLVYWFMFAHFLLEFLSCFAQLLLFFFSLTILVEFKIFDYLGVLFLHFQQKIAQEIEQCHIFLHSILSFISFRLEDLKQRCDFLSIFYSFCTSIIYH